MKDVQSETDLRNLAIDLAGIRNITYPITVKDRKYGSQNTVAKVNMSVNLPHNFKGTHMSRFVEVLHKFDKSFALESVKDILKEISLALSAECAHISLSFNYFLERSAPVSGQSALMDYKCGFEGTLSGNIFDSIMIVSVPVTSLCPCSKSISEFGAHNQRSKIRIALRAKKLVWIEEIIEYAENSASSPIYPLLKREDEKFVTEHAYKNPVFAEDMARNAAGFLLKDDRVTWFEVNCENMESIHNHNAWAKITIDKEKRKNVF